jgi:hypothetical protein
VDEDEVAWVLLKLQSTHQRNFGSGMHSSWHKEEMKDTFPTLPALPQGSPGGYQMVVTPPTQTLLYISSSIIQVSNNASSKGPGTILFSFTEAILDHCL